MPPPYSFTYLAFCSNDDFPLFDSMLDHKDLIFQDSTVRLVAIEPEQQNYKDYLGEDFLRSMQRMQEIDCQTAAVDHASSVSPIAALLLLSIAFFTMCVSRL